MQVPSEDTPSATLLAYSALSVVLLLSLAIAIFEAVAAIRRKFTYSSSNLRNKTTCRLTSCQGDRLRTKKMSLPEFTWMRHIRRCAKNGWDPSGSNKAVTGRLSVVNSPPKLAITTCSDVESDKETSNDSTYLESSLNTTNSLSSNENWCPITQLRQMGAVRFMTPPRRISTPIWSDLKKNTTTSHPNLRKISITNDLPRRSYAGMTSYAALPLTPGVARLCGSLSDILEVHQTESNSKIFDDNPIHSTNLMLPKNLLSLDQTSFPNSTALEARLKRIRLIRHR